MSNKTEDAFVPYGHWLKNRIVTESTDVSVVLWELFGHCQERMESFLREAVITESVTDSVDRKLRLEALTLDIGVLGGMLICLSQFQNEKGTKQLIQQFEHAEKILKRVRQYS